MMGAMTPTVPLFKTRLLSLLLLFAQVRSDSIRDALGPSNRMRNYFYIIGSGSR